MIKIYFDDVGSISSFNINELSSSRIEKANKYINQEDRKLSLLAGKVLDIGLKEFNLKEKDVIIQYNKYGKPYLKDYPSIFFNLSHSNKKAMCAISNKEVGCDIEYIKQNRPQIVKKYFSNLEKEYLENSNNIDEDFYKIWVGKESFLKAIGKGLNKQMYNFSIIPNENKINLIQDIDKRNWKIDEGKIDNYIYAICYQK